MKSFLKKIVIAVLTWEAKKVLAKYKPKVVAITGSVGKTSTKDGVFTVLSASAYARKSEKSFNSELGVPLTILGLPTAWSSLFGWVENIIEGLHLLVKKETYPEWLVLEVGADRPGDISSLAWLSPHVVIFTRFPDVPVHVEFFPTPADVIAEKRELKKALRPNGTLIVNHDDMAMREEAITEGQRVISYGFTPGAVVFADDYRVLYNEKSPIGVSCTVHFQNSAFPLTLEGALGRHHLYPLLAGIAVAVSEGTIFERAVEATKAHIPPPGRMRILPGILHSTVIDDCYNASPVAVEAGLSTFSALTCTGKKIVVLGDMMELGEYSIEEHRKVGEQVSTIANVLVTVGVRMLAVAEVAQAQSGMCSSIHALKDATEASELLPTLVAEGDLIYVKGSQSMRLEKVVEVLLGDPSSAPNVLVRQEKEWKEQ
jgi:UDP-N-acetylmuramyl pentapeptide synthase